MSCSFVIFMKCHPQFVKKLFCVARVNSSWFYSNNGRGILTICELIMLFIIFYETRIYTPWLRRWNVQHLTNKTCRWGQYGSLWTGQSVNCILPENICFICYIIPNIWIKKQVLFNYINKLVHYQQMINIKGLK